MTYYIFFSYYLISKHKSSDDPRTVLSISGFTSVQLLWYSLALFFSVKCTLPSKMIILVCILSTVKPIHRGSYRSEMVPNLESLNTLWSGKLLQEAADWEAMLGCWSTLWAQSLIWVIRLCGPSFSHLYFYLSPKPAAHQPSSPLPLLASLDPPRRKSFPLLGRNLLPLRVNTHTDGVGWGDSCPLQLSCLIYNALLRIRQSLLCFPVTWSQSKIKEEQRKWNIRWF